MIAPDSQELLYQQEQKHHGHKEAPDSHERRFRQTFHSFAVVGEEKGSLNDAKNAKNNALTPLMFAPYESKGKGIHPANVPAATVSGGSTGILPMPCHGRDARATRGQGNSPPLRGGNVSGFCRTRPT